MRYLCIFVLASQCQILKNETIDKTSDVVIETQIYWKKPNMTENYSQMDHFCNLALLVICISFNFPFILLMQAYSNTNQVCH